MSLLKIVMYLLICELKSNLHPEEGQVFWRILGAAPLGVGYCVAFWGRVKWG